MATVNILPSAVQRRHYLEVNLAADNFAKKVTPMLRTSAKQFTKGKKVSSVKRKDKFNNERTEYKLADKISYRLRNQRGTDLVEYIGFSFQRHGVFVHKGVGKGYAMYGGMVTRVTKGQSVNSNNPNFNKSSHGRTPVDWFNHILDAETPALANQVARIHADLALNSMRMKIN